MKTLVTYTFKGFGFEVLLKNVVVKSVDGEDYPDVDMNELKRKTAKALLTSPTRLTGHQLKFLRAYLKLSCDAISGKIHIPASTLRLWENKGSAFTGLSAEQEKAFRILAICQILDQEKNDFSIEVSLLKEFKSPPRIEALDLSSRDLSSTMTG